MVFVAVALSRVFFRSTNICPAHRYVLFGKIVSPMEKVKRHFIAYSHIPIYISFRAARKAKHIHSWTVEIIGMNG